MKSCEHSMTFIVAVTKRCNSYGQAMREVLQHSKIVRQSWGNGVLPRDCVKSAGRGGKVRLCNGQAEERDENEHLG